MRFSLSHWAVWARLQPWRLCIPLCLISLLVLGIQMLEKTLESPLDFKEIQPIHPKGNQSWVFIGRTDVEAEAPILWPPGMKNWLIWKDPGAGKDWRQEEKGTTADEMAGWHHRLDGPFLLPLLLYSLLPLLSFIYVFKKLYWSLPSS